jgi:hypothetical protein
LVGGLLVGLRLLELLLAAAQTLAARARIGELGRQLVAARLAEPLVLGRVRLGGLGEHLLGLLPDRGVAACRSRRGVARQQAAVERDHAHRYQPSPRAQRQHLREGRRQRLLVPGAEARDRRVIGNLVRRDHTKGDVLAAAPLDPATGALAERIRVQQQRHHHPGLERRPTPTVLPVGVVERAQLDLVDRVEHEPRQMILGQPLAQAWRQQQLLNRDRTGRSSEPPGTSGREDTQRIVLASPDDKPRSKQGLCDSLFGGAFAEPCASIVLCQGSGSASRERSLLPRTPKALHIGDFDQRPASSTRSCTNRAPFIDSIAA